MSLLSKSLKVAASSAMLLAATCSTAFSKDLTIGMSFQEMNNAYFVTMKQSLEDAAKEIGAKVIVTDARHDVSKQISDIEDMLQKDIDILLINPTDSVGVQSAVLSAKEAGVVTVAIDAQAEGPIDSFVGSKNYDAGYQAGKFLAESIGGKGEVAILDGIPVVPILERVRGFEDAIKEFPAIKIVTKQNGKQDRAIALNVTENILQSAPNLSGLFSVNDGGALGSLAAIEASGRDVKLVSVDGHPEAVKAIVKGNSPFIATSAQYPRDQVRIGLGIALAKKWGANVPTTVPVDIKLLTKDNAKGFAW
ncbi:putative ABC-type sugar transport system,periplasmic component [Vibrio nigripulchritudo MADA3029]|uniref:Autoinducer 2-binding periplasmic protein LuxP n=1 Tax=Vibrio nigripulchritudo SOn1 TaxID=1238450 RepID=A0AAV2VKY9_9VIBR|nr:ABC transporter substrate-binding protein [Vibrio nigripulchritudo]CCN33698.1 putative ABC-type sugar transport system,periplasmic component [Vibrio nigripulchritudo AM115]CCN41902.1 putative ABC-type sugar transport system,periplasmic component [Vibrio nigripulchritudo FTn2]CCN47478.1 putative ABC-type sugar transport system,periplasmic component [Vibrio nigripulchritudo MADA3020]CCN55884.1 putative ABC-type sugar transport system,periplasmic component [Vibrio nigripulchritudo MADA3021]CCN